MGMVDKDCEELAEPSGALKRRRIEEDITFSEVDVADIQFLHADAMIVNLNIDNYKVHHVLVNSESAVDILYFSIFSWMNLSMNRLEKYRSLIQDFSSDSVHVEGVITLPVKAGTYP